MPLHHTEQVIEALLPTFIHLSVSKSPGQDVRVRCQGSKMSAFQGRERGDVLAEVDTRSLFYASDSRPQLDDVEIELQHTILAE